MFEELLGKRLSRNCNKLYDIEQERHEEIKLQIEQSDRPWYDLLDLKRSRMKAKEDYRHSCRKIQIADDIRRQGIAGTQIMAERCSWNIPMRVYDAMVRVPRVINTMQAEDELKF